MRFTLVEFCVCVLTRKQLFGAFSRSVSEEQTAPINKGWSWGTGLNGFIILFHHMGKEVTMLKNSNKKWMEKKNPKGTEKARESLGVGQ